MEINDSQNIYPQHCGDSLFIKQKLDKGGKYLCEFIKYPFEIISDLNHIKRGVVNNPQIEQIEFIEKLWPQNCGDTLRILERIEGSKIWKVEFLKYPFITEARKGNIIKGKVENPYINVYKFLGQEFLQNCGDILIIGKGIFDENQKRILYEGTFKNFPYSVLVRKDQFLKGQVDNPRIEEEKFIGKKFKQNCGDFLRVIRKSNLKPQNTHNYYYECEFVSNSYKVLALKSNVLIGNVFNSANKDLISCKEKELLDYIKSIYFDKVYNNCWNILKDREIDIYIPKLKFGFEFNGCYWHSNEFKDKNYHLEKTKSANKIGIKLFHIWEDEWNKDKLNIKIWLHNLIVKNQNIWKDRDICKEGFVSESHSEPILILREDRFNCYNCGYNL